MLIIIHLNTREGGALADPLRFFHSVHLSGEILYLFERMFNIYPRSINILVIVILKLLSDNSNIQIISIYTFLDYFSLDHWVSFSCLLVHFFFYRVPESYVKYQNTTINNIIL